MEKGEFKEVDHDDPMVRRILNAAEVCVGRYGIRRTSLGEVARIGKFSRGSIYRYFADKEALIDGLFMRLRVVHLNRVEAVLEGESTLVDKMTRTVVLGRKNLGQGLFASLAEIEPETLATMFLDNRFYERSVEFWPPHICMAQQSGEISADVDIAFAIDFIMRLAVSLVTFPDMGLSLRTESEIRAYLSRLVKQGLGRGA